MKIEITATGTPLQVNNDVATQIKRARDANPDASAAISAFKDAIAADVRRQTDPLAAGEPPTVVVKASMEIDVTAAKSVMVASLAPPPTV